MTDPHLYDAPRHTELSYPTRTTTVYISQRWYGSFVQLRDGEWFRGPAVLMLLGGRRLAWWYRPFFFGRFGALAKGHREARRVA